MNTVCKKPCRGELLAQLLGLLGHVVAGVLSDGIDNERANDIRWCFTRGVGGTVANGKEAAGSETTCEELRLARHVVAVVGADAGDDEVANDAGGTPEDGQRLRVGRGVRLRGGVVEIAAAGVVRNSPQLLV